MKSEATQAITAPDRLSLAEFTTLGMPNLELILAWLIKHDTVSSTEPGKSKPTLPLAKELAEFFEKELGAKIVLKEETDPEKQVAMPGQASLAVAILPKGFEPEYDESKPMGIMLNGHMDKQPFRGQLWSKSQNPEELLYELDGNSSERLYARATIDMMGPLANMIAALIIAAKKRDEGSLIKPVAAVFSYGEEVGCQGTDHAATTAKELFTLYGFYPELIQVLEATNAEKGEILVGHKGGMFFDVSKITKLSQIVDFIKYSDRLEKDLEEYNNNKFSDNPNSVINIGEIQFREKPDSNEGKTVFNLTIKGFGGHSSAKKKLVSPVLYMLDFIDSAEKEGIQISAINNIGGSGNTVPSAIMISGHVTEEQLFLLAKIREDLDKKIKSDALKMKGLNPNIDPDKCGVSIETKNLDLIDYSKPNLIIGHARPVPVDGVNLAAIIIKNLSAKASENKIDVKQVSYTRPLMPKGETEALSNLGLVLDKIFGVKPKNVCVDFATEAGGFQQHFPNSTVVNCHPGDLVKQNAHKPDEYITWPQLSDGFRLLCGVITSFCTNKSLGQSKPEPDMVPSRPAVVLDILKKMARG